MTQRPHISPDPALIARLRAACAPDGAADDVLDLATEKSAFAFGWRDMPLIGDGGLPESATATRGDKRPEEA